MPTKEHVDAYLRTVRGLISAKAVLIVPREKNNKGMADLELTRAAALATISQMSAANYNAGPEPDNDRPDQHCWIFGARCEKGEAYIKLVVETFQDGRMRLKVLSFHPAAYPMAYPLA